MSRELVKTLANLGYGSRAVVEAALRQGRVRTGEGRALSPRDPLPDAPLCWDGEPLDPLPPLLLLFHKPLGYTCSHEDPGETIYTLLPPRFARRKPVLSSVGRLDKDTSGLLLLTDDGPLLHRLIHPRHHLPRRYRVLLERPLSGDEVATFASGNLLLRGEDTPCLPATLRPLGPTTAEVELQEGRYHQIRRMFAAVGNHVLALHRFAFGPISLPDDLAPGAYRVVDPEERARLVAPSP